MTESKPIFKAMKKQTYCQEILSLGAGGTIKMHAVLCICVSEGTLRVFFFLSFFQQAK